MLNELEIEHRLTAHGADRVWDGEEGITPSEAQQKGLKVKYVLVREDGWTLGCSKELRASAEKLYEDTWKRIYFLLDDGSPAIKLNYDEWCILSGGRQDGRTV